MADDSRKGEAMSDELFNDIQQFLDGQISQTEDGHGIKTEHYGDEPPDDGNEWLRVDLMQGGGFWVLTRIVTPESERPEWPPIDG